MQVKDYFVIMVFQALSNLFLQKLKIIYHTLDYLHLPTFGRTRKGTAEFAGKFAEFTMLSPFSEEKMIPKQFISISNKILSETAHFLFFFFSMRHYSQLNLSLFLTIT